MKYNILINQKAIIDSGLDIDIVDVAIFDCIYSLMQSASCRQMTINNVTYYWISTSLIISELPMLGIKSRQGVIKRIEKLIRNKLLIRSDASRAMAKAIYCKGDNFEILTTPSQQNLDTVKGG